MAGNIKGITIEFNGDTTKLDSALRDINKNTRALDKELRAVDKALKFNPTSVELWRQKQDLLKQKIEETKTKLDTLKQAQKKLDAEGVDKNSAEYRELSRQIVETESKVKHFEAQLKKVGQVNLRAASEQFKEYGSKLTAAGNAMRGVSTAAAAVEAAIGALTVKSAKWADDMNTMSKVYGISTGELQKYSAAAGLVDVSTEDIAKANTRLKKSMYSAKDGTGTAAEAYKALGVSVVDANGNLRNSDDVFQDVLQSLGQMENETERDALAMQLMGKTAQNLNPLIADGGETYKNVADTLKKYNLDFISQEDLDAANEFNDQIDTIKAIGLVAFQSLGTQLAGHLAPALEKVVDWVGKLAEWIGNLDPRIVTIVAAIGGVLAVLSPVLLFLGKISFAISSIMSLVSVIGPAIAGLAGTAFLPIVAAIGAVIAIGVLLYKHWDTIKAKALELWNYIQTVWEGIKTSIAEKLENIKTGLEIVWNAIKMGAQMYWNLIKTVILGPVGILVNLLRNNWERIKTGMSAAWNSIKATASAAWNGIKTAITSPFSTAVSTIKSIINKIKGLFPIQMGNIFKGLKLPHFTLKMSTKDFGKLGSISYPTGFSVAWYKKAMDAPYMFNSPTLFGAGEAGDEILYGRNSLMRDISNAVSSANGGGGDEITINVYASEGMDVKALAAEVERRLIEAQKRRTMVWQ